ncbi:U5 small nuclear ribonucleoprotein [Coelomomyces lativittatus]|nr:U5 small nuclear ribonucleoprotein [Coelomomyces lativittatus]
MSSKPLFTLSGHMDTITGLSLHPDGTRLLSTSLDHTLRVWDIKPYSPERHLACIEGCQHDFSRNLVKPCWSTTGRYIACGTGDRLVHVWEVLKLGVFMRLPGHRGTVNQVDWHPKEPILCSVSADKSIFMSELEVAG